MAKLALSGKLGVVIPVALGLAAIALTHLYFSFKEDQLGFSAEPVPVLIATTDIPRMTRLNEEMFAVQKVPRRFRQPEALDPSKGRSLLNQVAIAPIKKGEQIVGTKLIDFGVETGLAIKVPKGRRAVTIAVDDISGVAGLVKPGNHVDILATFNFGGGDKSDMRSYTLLQDVLVLAANQNLGLETEVARAALASTGERGGSRPPQESAPSDSNRANLTVALNPLQSQTLVWAQKAGKISLALRSQFESSEVIPMPAANVESVLGIKEQIMQETAPPWREIRGSSAR